MSKKSISITLTKTVVSEMKTFIDGVKIKNRSHLILIAVTEWMDAKRNKGKGEQLTLPKEKKRSKK